MAWRYAVVEQDDCYGKNPLDVILGVVSIQRFKCRSCGNYFRRWRRLSE